MISLTRLSQSAGQVLLFKFKLSTYIDCGLETIIFEEEFGVKTTNHTNSKKPSTASEDADEVEGSHEQVIELSDDEPYVTPFLLGKKIRKVVAPPPDDSDVEDSEVEQRLLGKVNKKGAVKSSNDKVG
jgi:hypothetical protein